MIIRKPYAFLIKRFKLIHLLLFIFLVYLMITTFNIFGFFNDYANSTFAPTLEYAKSYITIFSFLACVLVILISVVIYYLLNQKKKPKSFYMIISIFYTLLFVFFFIMLMQFKNLEYNTFSYEKVRVIRDICIIILVPQLVLMFITLGRVLGFNIKKFEFNKDLDSLEIDEKDYEEVEITLGTNNYKYKRAARKTMRLLYYFILENKFFITIICSTVALVVSLTVFVNLKIYNEHYEEEQQFMAKSVSYTASSSYLAYKDIYGNVIAKDRYYLLIKMNLKNKLDRNLDVDRNTFRLKLSGQLYIPKYTYGNEFLDVGETFSRETLYPGETKDVIIVFELDKTQLKKEYILQVRNASNISLGELNTEFIDIVIKPSNINKDLDMGKYNTPNKIKLDSTILGNTTLHISSASVDSSFREEYQNCYNDKCEMYKYVVQPKGKGNAVLKIKSNIDVDKNTYISNYIKYPSNFYKYFSKIYYRYEGVTKELIPNIIDTLYGREEYTYIEVPEKVLFANKIEMLIDIRGVKYVISLK